MAYVFHEVDIHAFDVHTTTKALLNPAVTQPAFRFLTNAADYRKQHKSGVVLKTPNFVVNPVTGRSLKRNRFWKYYKDIWTAGGEPDYWKLQMPFFCDPGRDLVQLIVNTPGFTGKVRPIVCLSAVGWSANLHISLKGNIQPSQLRDLVGSLQGQAAKPFTLKGNNRGLSEVFKHLSDQIRKDVYLPQHQSGDMPKVARYLVVSIARFTGPKKSYRSGATGAMIDSDRALMFGLLYGRNIKVPEWAKKDGDRSVMLTGFKDTSFALTDFQQGTLLFMQESALKPERRAALGCFGSNFSSCSMMTLIITNFYHDSARYSSESPVIKSLRNDIKTTLKELPNRYKNAVYRTFHMKYGPLQKLVSN